MGSRIVTIEALEVGHRRGEQIELGGVYPADAYPTSGGYVNVKSSVLMYVFYKSVVVQWKTLVLDQTALLAAGKQPTNLDISLILADT